MSDSEFCSLGQQIVTSHAAPLPESVLPRADLDSRRVCPPRPVLPVWSDLYDSGLLWLQQPTCPITTTSSFASVMRLLMLLTGPSIRGLEYLLAPFQDNTMLRLTADTSTSTHLSTYHSIVCCGP